MHEGKSGLAPAADDEKQHKQDNGANESGYDRAKNAISKVDSQQTKKPATHESPEDTDDDLTEQPHPNPFYHPVSQKTRDRAYQNPNQNIHFSLLPVSFITKL